MSIEFEMHMSGPVWMPIQYLEKASDWAVVGDWVRNWPNRIEPKLAIIIRGQDSSTVWTCSIVVYPLALLQVFAQTLCLSC